MMLRIIFHQHFGGSQPPKMFNTLEFGDWPVWIADPFTPGAWIEASAVQTGRLHCDQVMDQSDARAAVNHNLLGRDSTQQFMELGAQGFCRQERPIGAEVCAVKAVDRPRNMAGNRVDWLSFAPVAFRRASIDQAVTWILADAFDLVNIGDHGPIWLSDKLDGRAGLNPGGSGSAFELPFLKAAIQKSCRG